MTIVLENNLAELARAMCGDRASVLQDVYYGFARAPAIRSLDILNADEAFALAVGSWRPIPLTSYKSVLGYISRAIDCGFRHLSRSEAIPADLRADYNALRPFAGTPLDARLEKADPRAIFNLACQFSAQIEGPKLSLPSYPDTEAEAVYSRELAKHLEHYVRRAKQINTNIAKVGRQVGLLLEEQKIDADLGLGDYESYC